MKESIKSGGLSENMTAEDIAYSMLNGEPPMEQRQTSGIFSLWKLLFVFLGREIIVICIIIGLMTSFSDSFGQAVSSVGDDMQFRHHLLYA
ncbi:MAG: hypothetical protein V8Q42_03970 [Anaerovoracaceae bacterium]